MSDAEEPDRPDVPGRGIQQLADLVITASGTVLYGGAQLGAVVLALTDGTSFVKSNLGNPQTASLLVQIADMVERGEHEHGEDDEGTA